MLYNSRVFKGITAGIGISLLSLSLTGCKLNNNHKDTNSNKSKQKIERNISKESNNKKPSKESLDEQNDRIHHEVYNYLLKETSDLNYNDITVSHAEIAINYILNSCDIDDDNSGIIKDMKYMSNKWNRSVTINFYDLDESSDETDSNGNHVRLIYTLSYDGETVTKTPAEGTNGHSKSDYQAKVDANSTDQNTGAGDEVYNSDSDGSHQDSSSNTAVDSNTDFE